MGHRVRHGVELCPTCPAYRAANSAHSYVFTSMLSRFVRNVELAEQVYHSISTTDPVSRESASASVALVESR
jgi:hypothetical protein